MKRIIHSKEIKLKLKKSDRIFATQFIGNEQEIYDYFPEIKNWLEFKSKIIDNTIKKTDWIVQIIRKKELYFIIMSDETVMKNFDFIRKISSTRTKYDH
jgi:hypothetical protein